MLKYADNSRSRIQDGIKKYSRIVAQARQRGMNERDTADIAKAMLGDMLGYDPFFDVTAEISVRGNNADYAISSEGQLHFLLIVKGLGVQPNASHLLRLSGASTPPYSTWAILTNADLWACYRLGVGPDRHAELVFRVSLLDQSSLEEKVGHFFLLSKEGMKEKAIDRFWEETRVLNPGRIASLLLSQEVLSLLRRELQRTANYRVDDRTIYNLILNDVLSPQAKTAMNGNESTLPRLPQCYAYIRDPNEPATWCLRYRNVDTTPNAELLTLAVAELGGDVRALGIPADDIPIVKDRLREAFIELGVPAEDLPELVRNDARSG